MSVVPSGGHKFAQRLPNGSFHWFYAATSDDLVRQVIRFRAMNGIDPGNPYTEIKSQVSGATHKLPAEQRSLRERVTGWLSDLQFRTIRYVPQEEADARAKLAAECPYNIVDYADQCLECYQGTLRGLFAIRQGKSTQYDDKLGACSFHGYDNKTVVWLQPDVLSGISKDDPCWCHVLAKDDNSKVVS
jgi:hypothetical protein